MAEHTGFGLPFRYAFGEGVTAASPSTFQPSWFYINNLIGENMYKKNTAVTGFVLGLVSATDGSDITTGTPVGYYTLDGGTQTAIGDVTPVHEGNGQWSFDLLAAEMNGDVIGLTFTHASAITQHFTIKTDTKIVSELNDTSDLISATAKANLEDMYDGTGYVDDTAPSSRLQVSSLTSGSAAISTVSASAVVTTGTETLTYTATAQLDGSLHEVADVANSTEFYYQFSVGGNGVPVEFLWDGYAQSNGDSYAVNAYNWDGASWDQIGSITAVNGTTIINQTFQATNAHVGTGANLGLVRLQFTSSDGTHFATDRVLCSYAVVSQSVGYDGGQVWINTVSGIAGTEPYINGVADNQSLTLANAITLAAAIPLNRFFVSNDSTITFTESHTDETWSGEGWTLALGSQDISNTHLYHCNDISGIGTSPSGECHVLDSHVGALTLGVSHITNCSFKSTFDAGIAGNYDVENCKSGVAGAGNPTMTYSGLGSATTVNIRGWQGGGTWVFDVNCTASVEVLIGGSHHITTGGGAIEFRGTPKELTVVTSGTGTTNIIIWSGAPIIISGTGGTVNVYGIHNGITDTSTGTTVNDLGIDITKVDDILTDTDVTIPALLTDIQGATFATATDSLEAIRDRGDAAWTTGAGGSAPSVIDIRTEMDSNSTQLAAIVADTNELQTNQGNWLTPTGFATSAALATVDANVDAVLIDTGATIPSQITALNNFDPTTEAVANVTLVATATNVTNRVTANSDQIAGNATAATNLSNSALGIETGAAATGTLSTTQMTTNLTETTDDHYIGRVIVWTSGALANQATDITDYVGSTKLLTYTITTEAPSNGDTFVII